MPAAGTDHAIVVGGPLADRGGSRRGTLPYGEVRSGPGEITIGVESVATLTATQRTLFEQAVAAAGVDPANVLVVRLAESASRSDRARRGRHALAGADRACRR